MTTLQALLMLSAGIAIGVSLVVFGMWLAGKMRQSIEYNQPLGSQGEPEAYGTTEGND